MKYIKHFFGIIIMILFLLSVSTSCGISHPALENSRMESQGNEKNPFIGDADSKVDAEALRRSKDFYFEDLLDDATDFVKAEFRSYSHSDERHCYSFFVETDYRGHGLTGILLVSISDLNFSFLQEYGTIVVCPFQEGKSYYLLLTHSDSVFNERFFLNDPSLVIPEDYGEDPSKVLFRGADLESHFKTAEALSAFQNNELEIYVIAQMQDNPDHIGLRYTKASDIPTVVDFSDYVLIVTVEAQTFSNPRGDNEAISCTVNEVLKGSLDSNTINVIVPKNTVEKGSEYIVALVGSDINFTVSSMNSVFSMDKLDEITALVAEK